VEEEGKAILAFQIVWGENFCDREVKKILVIVKWEPPRPLLIAVI
jgi:hypothetical protein